MIISGTEPVNVIIIPDGPKGDAMLGADCVEITGLDPMPSVGTGWTYVKKKWVAPPAVEWTEDDVRRARRERYQAETDGMFFDAMRADTPNLAAWQAAVDQIKADLPYPKGR